MPFPTAYTEKTLADYMHSQLEDVAGVCGFLVGSSDAGSYQEAVYETLFSYGTDNIVSVSGMDNLKKIRALAKVQAWKKAVASLAARNKFSADGGSYDENQMYEQAKKTLEIAENDAMPYSTNYSANLVKVNHVHDPYQYQPEENRTI